MNKNNTLKVLLVALVIWINDVAVASERTGTLMVHLSYDKGIYSIVDTWVVSEIYPIKSGALAGKDALIFQLADEMDKEIARIKVNDPSILRAPPLSEEEVELMGLHSPHNTIVRNRGALILRFPLYENVRYINLLDSKRDETASGFALKSRSKQKMDLFNY
jgi:hypothetical protein